MFPAQKQLWGTLTSAKGIRKRKCAETPNWDEVMNGRPVDDHGNPPKLIPEFRRTRTKLTQGVVLVVTMAVMAVELTFVK